jgi:hypothetical protein
MNTDDFADVARSAKRALDAPPVVASMVVYRPGPWFVESLQALAAQTYPQLQTLFLVVGTHVGDDVGLNTDPTELIHSVLPQAVVRHIEGNPGFGLVSNEVARLVDGEGGFFCLMHDDVALDPEAIERLIEETYRSNAGLVGPKLVEWDDSTILQSVGLNVDRIGEVEPLIGENEKDQEQHDSVRDVFALSSACLLIRSDLFRELGGFNRHIDFFGEDDLETFFFGVKQPGGTGDDRLFDAGNLGDTPFFGQIAPQNRQVSLFVHGIVPLANHGLVGSRRTRNGFERFGDGFASNGQGLAME